MELVASIRENVLVSASYMDSQSADSVLSEVIGICQDEWPELSSVEDT